MIAFSRYQKFVIASLSFLQFTIILDFMILSPLGAILMPKLGISASQFGVVVSAYAFSAGASGFLAAGFADRFDRKKLLLFFYAGFVLGTLMCGLARDYESLLIARIVTGIFGGVVGSIAFAITTDLFVYEQRGRVMGIMQTAFAASQILGLPISLFLSNHYDWHAPFIMIVIVSFLAGIVMFWKIRPINAHLHLQIDRKPLHHLLSTLAKPRYLQGFATTALLTTGGFMIMPFASAFNVHNLGINFEDLPLLYLITGICTIFTGPIVGKLSDSIGKVKVFTIGSVISMVSVVYYTHLGPTPFWYLAPFSALMFVSGSSRMISSSALMSALPAPVDRGAYMSISSSIQQISGGLSAALAGMIIVSNPDGSIQHFDRVGWVIVISSIICVIMTALIARIINRGLKQ